jgi:hypothetical protein
MFGDRSRSQHLLEAAQLHRLFEPSARCAAALTSLSRSASDASRCGGGDQGAADAFQVRDAIGVAVLDIRTDVELREPEGTVLVADREQDGQRFAQTAGEELRDLARVVARLGGPGRVALRSQARAGQGQ